jgi:outer membrane protein assembly factor BamB
MTLNNYRVLFSVIAFTTLLASCGGPKEPAQPAAPPAASTPPAAAAPARPPVVKAGWTVTDMRTPESAYLDEGSGYLYVSQIDGQPGDKDGKGRISKLGLDGSVITADWVTGLNAPKGLRSFGGTLWCADIDEVLGIDINSGKITSRIHIDGAKFLNDVAAGADGTIYISDTMTSKIHTVKDGKAAVFAEGEQLEYPNGLFVEGERLIVGGWGKPEADFTTKVPGHLYSLDLKTKKKTLITKQPLGNIDGLEQDARGGYVAGDYMAGKLYQVSGSGESRVVRQFKPGLADFSFLYAQGDILIAPHMNENTVSAEDLAADMK